MVEFGRRSGLELECGTLEDYRDEEQFDLIAMLQSMMHFTTCGAHASGRRPH